ncbi:MAG: hypothetical protein ACC658_09860, partial [Acidimicrobiia bacterium]
MDAPGRTGWLRPSSKAYLMVLALVIGVGAGFGAAALIYALRFVSDVVLRLTDQGPSLGRAWLFLV